MNKISRFHSSLFILNECHEAIEHLYFQFAKCSHSEIRYHKNLFQHEMGNILF